MVLPRKRKEIYILDCKNIPHKYYLIKLNSTHYFDSDGEPIDCPEEVENPKLGENYINIRQGKIGILRNAKIDYSKETEGGLIKNDDGTTEDPGYEPSDVVYRGFEWVVVFDGSWLAYQDNNSIVDAFTRGEFNVYVKQD
jgi:hypothetical protein